MNSLVEKFKDLDAKDRVAERKGAAELAFMEFQFLCVAAALGVVALIDHETGPLLMVSLLASLWGICVFGSRVVHWLIIWVWLLRHKQ